MCYVIKIFNKLLREHKRNIPMINYVMELDDWGHYVKYKPGVEGLIAQLLWYDRTGKYKLYKLQMAIDKACVDKKFGQAIYCALNAIPWDNNILECALPELNNLNFVVDVWTPQGLDDLICGYDGMKFNTSVEKLSHIKKLLGTHFFNCHSAVKCAISQLGLNADHKEIFTCAKNILYKSYGEQHKVLHTARAKVKLQLFINKLTSLT